MCMYTYIYIYTHVYIYIYIYVYTYVYVYIYIYNYNTNTCFTRLNYIFNYMIYQHMTIQLYVKSGPRPWHIEIRHRVKRTSTINLLGFETLKLKFRRLKLWKPTVAENGYYYYY